jgi:hypothetical protein
MNTNELINAEIDAEHDRLLAGVTEDDLDATEAMLRRQMLRRLGFAQHPEARGDESVSPKLYAIHYRNRYSSQTFITVEALNRICDKYGLVYGHASLYTGDISDDNLLMLEYRIDAEDKIDEGDCTPVFFMRASGGNSDYQAFMKRYLRKHGVFRSVTEDLFFKFVS